ncbi:MAG: hypothetical protein PHF97_08400 [Bacteroidales bacterium]|nr:hypothetical protein [Bacteroidales bacterium]
MKYLYKYTPEFVLIFYILLFIGFKSPERSWDRIINSDGKGYYAYLPAIFIYHDLQYKFVEQYEAQYYPANKSVFKEFRNQAGSRTVNKYFPGLAILWLPFFLFGHLMAYLEIFPQDGYSLPYQYAIAFSALLFLWLGARWLQRLLKKFGSGEKRAAFLTLTIILGTNLIFYSIVEPSMTHVYSFALITGFCCTCYNLFHDYRPKWFIRSLFLLVLIFLIRPTNGLIVLLVPFLAGSWTQLRTTFQKVISEKMTLIRGIIPALILISVPLLLWHMQTGKWLVYTYCGEKLSFFHPHALQLLFSYNRGWFIYTPIAFISLIGLIGLFKQNRFRFYWLTGFLIIFIYVSSCWWVWYYASKCGQRIFVDIYPLVALLLLFLFQSLKSRMWRGLLTTVLVLLIGLNLLQFYQHTRWIFPPYNISKAMYWDSFFSLNQKAKVYLPEQGIASQKIFSNDMETDRGPAWMNPRTRYDSVFHQGHWSSRADKKIPYSLGFETGLDSLFTTGNRLIRIEAWVLAPKEMTEATLVVDYQSEGKSLSYNQFILEKFVPADQWTKIEAAFYVPRDLPGKGTAKVYFFNPSPLYKLYVDDLKIGFISMKDEPDYRKIEGILMPEKIK